MRTMLAALVAVSALFAHSDPVPAWADRYDLKLTLKVPAIVDNMESKGKRVYKTQRLRGTLVAYYYDEGRDPYLAVVGLYNKDYKIRGKCVTYETMVSGVLWRAVGDNRNEVFRKAAFGFRLEADPSYNVGDDEPDNTLILTLAGAGTVRSVFGSASGQLGCGCMAYGHVSPTRVVYCPYVGSKWVQTCWPRWWYPTVVDIAPCWGTWSIKFRDRSYVKDVSPCVQVDYGE